MNDMSNNTIREAAKTNKIPLWKIADALSISEATLTRKLRHEMREPEARRMMQLMNELKGVNHDGGTGQNQKANPDGSGNR